MTALVQEVAPGPRCRIRSFRPGDRTAVREICAATGLLGDDIRCLFPKPDFFVDLFTSYYTDLEPESCLVVEAPEAEDRCAPAPGGHPAPHSFGPGGKPGCGGGHPGGRRGGRLPAGLHEPDALPALPISVAAPDRLPARITA